MKKNLTRKEGADETRRRQKMESARSNIGPACCIKQTRHDKKGFHLRLAIPLLAELGPLTNFLDWVPRSFSLVLLARFIFSSSHTVGINWGMNVIFLFFFLAQFPLL